MDLLNPEIQQVDDAIGEGVKCDQCERIFSNEQGLRVHTLRKHTPGGNWDTARNFRKNKKAKRYPSESSEYKKKKYQEQKARFAALGLNARGFPLKSTPKTRRPMIALGNEPIRSEKPSQPSLDSKAVNYCPHCGFNIRRFL